MTENSNNNLLDNLLNDDGPIALIIKQPLEPVDSDDRVIFPPTYPVTKWKGRVHTVRDGDYRVSVQLPPDSKADKDGNKDNQKPGYQIDYFPDGSNVCEIDSPQSQSNRIEPKFKTIKGGRLVPQVEIQIGNDKKNLLEIGHRAGDAAVRMSSMAAEFHDAFTAAKRKDFFELATLAPTSLVFGVWDSRSTYVKQQRIFKAYIRATNVFEMSRSAQFTPATNYVDAEAIGDDVEKKEGDESNLSQEGMVHALSIQAAGGVMLTEKSELVRTTNVNLEAIRQLSAAGEEQALPDDATEEQKKEADKERNESATKRTSALQKYILGLALVAAIEEPDLNLREGCHIHFASGANGEDGKKTVKLVYRSKASEDRQYTREDAQNAAGEAKDAFFKLAGIDKDKIDHPDEKFEKGVAEEFLKCTKKERDAIRKLGPITADTLKRFKAKKKSGDDDPIGTLRKLIDDLKFKKSGGLTKGPFDKLKKKVDQYAEDDSLDDDVKTAVTDLKTAIEAKEGENEFNKIQEKPGVKDGWLKILPEQSGEDEADQASEED